MTASSKDYLSRIQGLRFFAAFAVLVGHLQHEVATRLMPGVPFSEFTAIDGGVGVDVFFLISGFIMYHVSARQFGRPGASARFLGRRIVRVAPLYYLATLLLVAMSNVFANQVAAGGTSITHIVASLLFLPHLNAQGVAVPVLKLGWTLNFEAYFYALFTLALMLPKRSGIAAMTSVMAAVVAIAALWPGRSVVLDFWGNSIVFEFVGGVGIAILYERAVRLNRAGAWATIGVGLALLVSMRLGGMFSYLPRCLFHGVPAALIVAGVALGPLGTSGGREMNMLALGGDASYALYLFHPFAIRGGTIAWHTLGGPDRPWLFIATVAIFAIAFAIMINLTIEKRLDEKLRSWVDRRATT